MGVRQWLNQQNRMVVLAGAVGIIVIVVACLTVLQRGSNRGDGGRAEDGGAAKAFFSIDEGKTWFREDARKIPPFTRDGKEAVRAYVYKCDDGKEFVGFVERYTPELKRKLEAADANGGGDGPMLDAAKGIEVKGPGQASWIKQSDTRAMAIMTPKCANGEPAQMVTP
jgi:hypothetical protein